MTAPITAYTTTDSVRACMGVTDNEMDDDMLLDMGLSLAVISDLEEFLPNHETVWNDSKAANATTNQILAGRYIELFCSYDGAHRALDALLAIPQEVSDGKASISRFSVKEQIIEAQARIKNTANEYRAKLKALAGATVSSSTGSVMGAAKPSLDPVTGIRT